MPKMRAWGKDFDAKPCVWTDSDNHSDDLLAVFHGDVIPTFICGYHEESRGIPQGEDRHLIAEQHAMPA